MDETIGTMLARVARLMRRDFDVRARDLGVTRPQWLVLTLLAREPGINQGGLADLLEVEPITAGRMIDRLQEAGMVERRSDPADRRAWRLHLTARGDALLDQLKPAAQETLEIALAGMADPERSALMTTLVSMRANLTRKPVPREGRHG